jgi:hypothetical protein
MGRYFLWLDRLRQRVDRTPSAAAYTDAALTRTEPTGDPANDTRAA